MEAVYSPPYVEDTLVDETIIVLGNDFKNSTVVEVGDNNAVAIAVTLLSQSVAGVLSLTLECSNNKVLWLAVNGSNKLADATGAFTLPSAPGFAVYNVAKLTTAFIRVRCRLTSGTALLRMAFKLTKRG